MDLVLKGRRVPVDITSDHVVTSAQRSVAAIFTRDAAHFDGVARAAIAADHDNVTLYVEHHVAELHLEAPQVLEKLVLARIGLYPQRPSRLAVFDYTLDGNVTQYVLAVAFDKAGSVVAIDMES